MRARDCDVTIAVDTHGRFYWWIYPRVLVRIFKQIVTPALPEVRSH